MIVSRHFSLLAGHEPLHRHFLQGETVAPAKARSQHANDGKSHRKVTI